MDNELRVAKIVIQSIIFGCVTGIAEGILVQPKTAPYVGCLYAMVYFWSAVLDL